MHARLRPPARSLLAMLLGILLPGLAPAGYVPSAADPPGLPREFRGVWLASVGNIHWPSKAGLSSAEQRAELIRILDRAVETRLNTVILQVRPGCDALYSSRLEPWSEYLSGAMGRAPSPLYDPLAFAVEEAHRRGLEIHAWFNPFRARHSSALSPVSRDHISRRLPALVLRYGALLWLDPGEKAAVDHSLKVVLDVVRRYNIDGVHLDDYFYPYPEKDASGRELPFPDGNSWRRYVNAGGRLTREDWRRENVNGFVRRLYQGIKAEKRHVKFGISPFGIWRPGTPPEIRGFDAYAKLYADARLWLERGWVDYLSPQLYWRIDQKQQSYPTLLQWWSAQNPQRRHLWPGNQLSHGPDEIVQQIGITRRTPGATGNILWGARFPTNGAHPLLEKLEGSAYTTPALVPASRWLDAQSPTAPDLHVAAAKAGAVTLRWKPGDAERASLWVVQTRRAGQWETRIMAGAAGGLEWVGGAPEVVAVTAVDRAGNASPPSVVELESTAPRAASP